MGDRITAAQARTQLAKIQSDRVTAQQKAILPHIYGLIAEAVDMEKENITLDEIIDVYPKASLLAVKQVLVDEDGYDVTGTTISWAE